jgi:CheY-like chemotaxis protein
MTALVPAPSAPQGVSDAIEVAERVGEQTQAAQSWLNEGGAAGTPGTIAPLRILLVEDDAIIAVLTAETLQSMGHEVCTVANEADAVSAAARERPDLLIVDAHLSEGSGLNAVRRILLNGPVPHIFVSGDVLSAEQLNPSAILLQKPFQEKDLARAISQAFAGLATR